MNSTVRIILTLFVTLLVGCQEEQLVEAPSDLIPEEAFVGIMVDLSIIEATRSLHSTKEHKLDTHPTIFYRQLWEDHHISQDQFERSFAFYRMDLDHMAEIYEKVALIIKRKEDDINAAKSKLKEKEEPAPTQVPVE